MRELRGDCRLAHELLPAVFRARGFQGLRSDRVLEGPPVRRERVRDVLVRVVQRLVDLAKCPLAELASDHHGGTLELNRNLALLQAIWQQLRDFACKAIGVGFEVERARFGKTGLQEVGDDDHYYQNHRAAHQAHDERNVIVVDAVVAVVHAGILSIHRADWVGDRAGCTQCRVGLGR